MYLCSVFHLVLSSVAKSEKAALDIIFLFIKVGPVFFEKAQTRALSSNRLTCVACFKLLCDCSMFLKTFLLITVLT